MCSNAYKMCHPLIFIVLQVLTLQSVTSFPCKDYILAYIPIEELAYLLPENIQAMPVPYYNNALFYDPWYYQGRMMQSAWFPYRQTTGPVAFGGQVEAKGGVTSTGSFGNHGFGTFTSYSASPTPLIVTPQPALPATSNLLVDTISPISTSLPTITTLPAVTLPSPTINLPFTDIMPSTLNKYLHSTFFPAFTSYSAPPTPLIVTPQPTLPATYNLLVDTISPISTSLPTITTLPEVKLPSPTINQPFTDIMPSTVSVPTMPLPFIVVTTTVPYNRELNGNVASSVKFSGMVPASGRVRISRHFC